MSQNPVNYLVITHLFLQTKTEAWWLHELHMVTYLVIWGFSTQIQVL